MATFYDIGETRYELLRHFSKVYQVKFKRNHQRSLTEKEFNERLLRMQENEKRCGNYATLNEGVNYVSRTI